MYDTFPLLTFTYKAAPSGSVIVLQLITLIRDSCSTALHHWVKQLTSTWY